MDTDRLIAQLAADAPPVRPLGMPGSRSVRWLALSAPIALAVALAHGLKVDIAAMLADPRFLIEQIAAAGTAVTAGIAAFSATAPGADRRWLWVPFAFLALWLATLGSGCVADLVTLGRAGLALHSDLSCIVTMALVGIGPAGAMAVMLRRGAPLMPRLTLVLAALAVGGLCNVVMRFAHAGDLSIVILVWHMGTLAALVALAGATGGRLLRWRNAPPRAVL